MTRKMKDSGIKWIGEIPEDWEIRKLKYTLEERNEKNNPIVTDNILSLSVERGIFPYTEKTGGGNKSKSDLTAYKVAHPNDIVINSMIILAGAVGLSRYTGVVSPVYYTLYTTSEEINITYYYYLFRTREFQQSLLGLGNGIMMRKSSTGKLNTIRMRIPMDKLAGLFLPLPPRRVQDLIVKSLAKDIKVVNKLINQTEQSIKELKNYKQSLITESVTKGIDPNVEMKESGVEWIGHVPEHWLITRPNRINTVVRGNSGFQKIDMKDTGDYVAVQYGQVYKLDMLDEMYQLYVDGKFYKEEQVAQKGDTILISTSETIEDLGHSCFYNRTDFGLLGGEQLCLKPNKQVLFDKFLYYATTYFNLELNQYATGLKVSRFKLDDLKKINIIVPPTIEEQQQIVEYLDDKVFTIDKLIEDKTKVIEELENYKKSLIYEYVTGKKEV
ncbi:restriction endonuclease subunit S [Staphylococcus delphini]